MTAWIETYLEEKMTEQLGEMFDLAVNYYEVEGERFWDYFVTSGRAKQFEARNVRLVLGRSSAENAAEILAESGNVPVKIQNYQCFDRSPEYWSGWILAQYQQHAEISYRQIHRLIRYQELLSMYPTYHEAPPQRLYEELDRRRAEQTGGIRRQREARGLSQADLARESGIGLRSIQAYEQGWKDIRHAKGESLYRLARALDCRVEDLIE